MASGRAAIRTRGLHPYPVLVLIGLAISAFAIISAIGSGLRALHLRGARAKSLGALQSIPHPDRCVIG
jgi:hypothetical protein